MLLLVLATILVIFPQCLCFSLGYSVPPSFLQCDHVVNRTIRICLVMQQENLMGRGLPANFETRTVNSTNTLFPGPNGTCYSTQSSSMMFYKGEYMGIYNITQFTMLDTCDLIVGAYFPSIASYSFHKRKIYMCTTPLPFMHEHKRVYHQYMLSMWPSYHTAVEAVNLFLEFKTSTANRSLDVFIIHHCETLDATNYVNTIYTTLQNNRKLGRVESYSILGEVNKLRDTQSGQQVKDMIMAVYNIFYHLRRKLSKANNAKPYDLVILMMDFPDVKEYMRVLKILFSKEADLERSETQWFVPDMTFGHRQGMLEALQDVHVIQTTLTFIQHKPFGDCEIAGYGIEHRGQQFAVETLKNAFGALTKDAFSMHKLWVTIKEQRQWKDDKPLSTTHDVVRDGTYPSDVTMSFVDYATTKDHPTCTYETTQVYLSAYSPELQRLSQGVGGFADAKIVRHSNESASLYGLIPPDAELEAVLVLDAPFIMRSESSGDFEGIAIDIYQEIRKTLMAKGISLNLEFREVDFYGEKANGSWNGAFGELVDQRRTKVALGQISITDQRRKSFAFTPPFGFIHRTYMIRKQEKSDVYLQFARPFTNIVWLALLFVVVTSAVYIFLLDRWNPFRDLVPRIYQFTGYESLWYSYLTMCHLSAPFAARNLPIQIFSIFYWFFSMIVVGSYTGNLASSLTDAYFIKPQISSDISMLPQQSEFRFGAVAHTATSNELKNVMGTKGESLYDIIHRRGDFVESYGKGFERVRNGSFILIGTSSVMSHVRNTDPECALELSSDSYYDTRQVEIGFAMKKDWDLREEFSSAMAYLMETGRIASIYYQWQKQGACESSASLDSHARMSFKSLTGLFIMLAIGIAVSYVFLLMKLIYLKITRRTAPVQQEEEAAAVELNDSALPSDHSSEEHERETKIDEDVAETAEGNARCTEENEVDNTSEYDNYDYDKKMD